MIDSPEEIAEVREFFAGLPQGEQRRLMQFFADTFTREPQCPQPMETEVAVSECQSGREEVDQRIVEIIRAAVMREQALRQNDAKLAEILLSKPDYSEDSTTPPLKDI